MNKVVSVYLVSALAGISTLCGGSNLAYAADKDLNSENVEMLSAERNKVNAATSPTNASEADNAASKSLQLLLGNMKQFRAGFDQTSEDRGQLNPGEVFKGLEGRLNSNGILRIRMAKGWVSAKAGKCCYFLVLWVLFCSISHVPTRMTRSNRESIAL